MAKDKPPSGSRIKPTTFGPDVFDYSECEFLSLEGRPLPDEIQHLLFRAFHSFGPDTKVMKERWQVKIIGSDKLEAEVFPHSPGVDICCADIAAWALYQTGQLDHGTAPHKQIWVNKEGWSFPKAAYWLPGPHNEAWVTCLKSGNKVSDFFVPKKPGDETSNAFTPIDEWLPGDYVLYCNDKGDPKSSSPGHINVYLGPFQEIGTDGALVPGIYHLINGSIHSNGGNAVVRPKPLDNLAYGYLQAGKTIWHCRVPAIAALFNDVVGWPVRVAKPAAPAPATAATGTDEGEEKGADGKKKKKKSDGSKKGVSAPDPDAQARAKEASIVHLWEDTLQAETSYPLGKNLSWHDGVHLHPGAHLVNDDVLALGPGQLALARMGAPTPFGDTSFVLLEHWIDPVTRKVLTPPSALRKAAAEAGKSPAEDQRKKLVKDRALRFYTLYMHLAPLETYLDAGKTTLVKGAPAWLGRLWPMPVPPPREIVQGKELVTALVTWTKGKKPIALQPAATFVVGQDADKTECRKITAGGTPLLALPHRHLRSNVEAWSGANPMATIPTERKLCFFNPLDHSIITLEIPLTPEMGLAASAAGALKVCKASPDGGAYVAINAFTRPGYEGSAKDYELTDHGTIRLTSAKAKLYLDTLGEGDKARFVRTASVKLTATPEAPIELRIKEQAAAGKARVADRQWIDLVPCVRLTADERTSKEAKLKADVELAVDVKDRLDKRQSCLFGVKVGAHDEWVLDDHGLLVPNQALLAKLGADAQVVTLYPDVKGQGKSRSLGTPGKGVHIDSDSPALFKIKATSEVAVTPLEIFEVAHRTFALIEVMMAVPESALKVSTEEADRVKKLNQQRKPILDKLLKREVVSFLDLDDDERNVPAGPIGRIGKDGPRKSPGFHFEVFSGENVIDRSVKGTADTIVEVPKSRWLVFKDGKDEPFTVGQVRRFLKALDALPEKHRIDTRPLAAALGREGVIKPEEWLAFSRQNVHRLSQIITVHKPEWAVAWEDVHKSRDTRGQAFGDFLRGFTDAGKLAARAQQDDEARKKEAKEILQAFQWWGDDVKLPGIPDKNAVFFYHPLRFIEWLRTGVELTIAGLVKPKDASIKITLQGQEIPLEYDEISGAFSFRTVLGEVVQGQFARVTLESGVKTEVKEIGPVRVRRGQITHLQLVNPGLSISVERDIHGIGFAVDVAQKEADVGHDVLYLLADGNLRLTNAGYSRATFRIDLTYNLVPPTKVKIALKGEGFRIAEYSVTGLDVEDAGDGKLINDGKQGKGVKARSTDLEADEVRLEEPPPAGEKPVQPKRPVRTTPEGEVHLPPGEPKRALEITFKAPPPPTSFERSGKVSIYCHVQVTEADVGESGFGVAQAIELDVETEGGDLGSRKAHSAQIATREIERAGAKDSPTGSDIAKLQLYLAQIRAVDHLPCYRPAGSHKEAVVDARGKKKGSIVVHDEYSEEHHTVTVDGRYGGDLARGLWRFIYSYAGKEGWNLGKVKIIDDHGKKASIPISDITAVDAEKLLDAHAPALTSPEAGPVQQFIDRVNHPSEHPVVDGALLAEIVSRFHAPLVLPKINFQIVIVKLGKAYPGVMATEDFIKNWISNSALLPAGDRITLKLECPRLHAVRGDEQMIMSFPEGSSYVFEAGGARSISGTLHELCKDDNHHEIVPSGLVGDDPKKHVVAIRARDGRLVNSLQLAGVPDLRVVQQQPTRAAAMLQLYLSAIPESADRPEGPRCYQVTRKGKDKATHAVVNGIWDKGSVAALERYKKGHGGGDDYKALVEAIEKAHASAAKPAGAVVEDASAPSDDNS
jgi:hypothetical protein